ncbi:MAG: PHB depolymerase family esterase, partial [Phycisphaeraceae bacterium]
MLRCAIFILLLWLAFPILGQDEPLAKSGVFEATFTERSPLTEPTVMSKVTRWPIERIRDYTIGDHTFQLIVPKAYDGSKAFGLIVFIHPNNTINIDRFYGRVIEDVLTKHQLIWVSYNNAGNDVMPNVRLGLALDAVHNMTKRYRIDDKRVYVSGLSGGGRMTCMAGIYYPQVFTGAVPIVGTLYFRDVKLPE